MEIYKNLNLDNLDGEIWKDIESYDGDYKVSNLGRIKSFKYNKINGEILKQNKDSHGYLCIKLYKNGKGKTKLVHHLVYETFGEKLKEGECVHHLDENPLNNNLNNFKLMNISEHKSFHNSGEKHYLYGKHHTEETKLKQSKKLKNKFLGEKNPMFGKHHSKKSIKLIKENNSRYILTEKDIHKIRIDLDEGILTQKEIGKKFGVSKTTISLIKNKKRWNI